MANATLQPPELLTEQKPAPVDIERRRAYKGLIFFGILLCIIVISQLKNKVLADNTWNLLNNAKYAWDINIFREMVFNPKFYCVLALAVLVEKLYPARSQQSLFSNASFSDLLWVAPNLFFFSSAWLIFIAFAHAFYDHYLAFLTIHLFDNWPWYLRFVIALAAVDFLAWLSHYVRHKVPSFWSFHSVHHAQTNLNFFTVYRSHILDELLKYTLEAIPLFMLEQSFVQIITISQIRYWHSALYHCNIKGNYGFLRYVLVTPQSHRIHHSAEEKHRDTNFGATFAIWDLLFGTQYKNYEEYPETGISDPNFPVDKPQSIINTLKTFLLQFFYPLKLPAIRK